MVTAIIVLIAYQLTGEVIVRTLMLPVPGPVIGMLLLLTTLLLKNSLVSRVEALALSILDNLTLFYIPTAVGVMVHLSLIRSEGAPIILTMLASTIVSLTTTALLMKLLLSVQRRPAAVGGE